MGGIVEEKALNKLTKIEKIGDEAVAKTLELFSDGKNYTEIARKLQEIYGSEEVNIEYRDVRRLLSNESKAVSDYVKKKKRVSRLKMDLLLDREGIVLKDLEKLGKQQEKIEDNDEDLYKQTRAMIDLAEARQNILKKYKSIVEESETKPEINAAQTNILNVFGEKDKEMMKKLMSGLNFAVPNALPVNKEDESR